MRVQLIVTFDTPEVYEIDDSGRKTYSDTFVSRIGQYLIQTGATRVSVEGCDLDPAILELIVRKKS
jgi:hypothetical protein